MALGDMSSWSSSSSHFGYPVLPECLPGPVEVHRPKVEVLSPGPEHGQGATVLGACGRILDMQSGGHMCVLETLLERGAAEGRKRSRAGYWPGAGPWDGKNISQISIPRRMRILNSN